MYTRSKALDQSERHDFWPRLWLLFSSFLFPHLLKKREEEKENEVVKIVIKINAFQTGHSFNTSISHQLFDNKITLVNSQRENTNSKGDFVLKNWFDTFALKIFGIQKYILVKNIYFLLNTFFTLFKIYKRKNMIIICIG